MIELILETRITELSQEQADSISAAFMSSDEVILSLEVGKLVQCKTRIEAISTTVDENEILTMDVHLLPVKRCGWEK